MLQFVFKYVKHFRVGKISGHRNIYVLFNSASRITIEQRTVPDDGRQIIDVLASVVRLSSVAV